MNTKICKESLYLENNNIYLRSLRIEDITDSYIKGLNDPEVNKYLVYVNLKIQTFKTVKEYVQSNIENPCNILLGIFLKQHPSPLIGTVHISGLDFFNFMSSVGICLFNKEYWGKGFAGQSLERTRDYLFGSLGLHYLEGGVYADNERSIKLFTSVGFSEMYRVKNKYRHMNCFKEVIFFGITNPLFDMSLLNQQIDLNKT